jgi:hypothetical protein
VRQQYEQARKAVAAGRPFPLPAGKNSHPTAENHLSIAE